MINVKDITFAYARHAPIFERFSWQVNTGQSWAVIGASGCGKTTLLYLLAGLRHPDAGYVVIGGERIERPRPETGLILQDHGLLPWATVWHNAMLGLTIRDFYGADGRHAPREGILSRGEAEQRVTRWLQRLGIKDLAEKYPGQLSGGQRQRTAIVRTLSLEPDVLLMDEPFSALDAPTREDLQNLTAELSREAALTTVIVTHNIEEAVFLGEWILVLGDPPNREPHIIHNPGAGRTAYRGESGFLKTVEHVRTIIGSLHERAS